MPQPITLTSDERAAIEKLAARLRAARLRRNLSQATVASRSGVSRKTYVDLEAGKPGVSLSILVKAIGVLGYLDRISALMETDPIGEEIELEIGRRHAGGRRNKTNF